MKILKGFGKIVLAGLLSIAILSIIMCFYSLLPVHIENEKGNTDYVWPANSVWVKATEGISWGKFDANGFNNLSVINNPDIIILGSSHMEACNVMQNQTTAYLLNTKLNGDFTYNMGISGHNFFKVCQYIPSNLELFDEIPKVVVIETSTVNIQQENVNQILTHTIEHAPSHGTGLIGTLQKIPFLRTVYQQIDSGLLKLFMPSSFNNTETDSIIADEDIAVSNQGDNIVDENAYAELFDYLSQIEQKYGIQIVIFYHPTGTITKDAKIEFKSGNQLRAFEQYSKNYDINFIDMTSYFEDMYYIDHHVAHGFITGELESGHLNAYGHSSIANALYNEIKNLEEAGKLCQ